jgi:hypothetical protein
MENFRMRRQPDLPADLFLAVKPENHNDIVWEQVYQKYAPLIYAIILNMTVDKLIAADIFKGAFYGLKRRRILSRTPVALCQALLRHAYKLTLKYLEMRGMTAINSSPFHSQFKLLNMLYFDLVPIKEAAQKLNMTEQELLRGLRMEFIKFRRHSWVSQAPVQLAQAV